MWLPVKVVLLDVTGNWVYRLCCSRAIILGIQFLTDSFLAPQRIAATFLDFLQTVPVNFACWGKKKNIACFFSLIFNCLDSASPATIVVSCSWRTEKVPDVDFCCCLPRCSCVVRSPQLVKNASDMSAYGLVILLWILFTKVLPSPEVFIVLFCWNYYNIYIYIFYTFMCKLCKLHKYKLKFFNCIFTIVCIVLLPGVQIMAWTHSVCCLKNINVK